MLRRPFAGLDADSSLPSHRPDVPVRAAVPAATPGRDGLRENDTEGRALSRLVGAGGRAAAATVQLQPAQDVGTAKHPDDVILRDDRQLTDVLVVQPVQSLGGFLLP